jgi:hypothetical protein
MKKKERGKMWKVGVMVEKKAVGGPREGGGEGEGGEALLVGIFITAEKDDWLMMGESVRVKHSTNNTSVPGYSNRLFEPWIIASWVKIFALYFLSS